MYKGSARVTLTPFEMLKYQKLYDLYNPESDSEMWRICLNFVFFRHFPVDPVKVPDGISKFPQFEPYTESEKYFIQEYIERKKKDNRSKESYENIKV